MIDASAYEHINLVLAIMCWMITFIFVRYLIAEFQKYEHASAHMYDYTFQFVFDYLKRPMVRHQMAAGLVLATGGEAFLRTWTWAVRFSMRIGVDLSRVDALFRIMPISAAILQIIGLICLIRVFTPETWSRYLWIYCVLLAVAIIIITTTAHFV